MKMELLAALLHKPTVLFLDAPTIGLDIIAQKKIRDFLKYYNEQEKLTVMLTSHYMEDIEALCPRSIVISHGKLVYDGKTNEISPEHIPVEEGIAKLYQSGKAEEDHA